MPRKKDDIETKLNAARHEPCTYCGKPIHSWQKYKAWGTASGQYFACHLECQSPEQERVEGMRTSTIQARERAAKAA